VNLLSTNAYGRSHDEPADPLVHIHRLVLHKREQGARLRWHLCLHHGDDVLVDVLDVPRQIGVPGLALLVRLAASAQIFVCLVTERVKHRPHVVVADLLVGERGRLPPLIPTRMMSSFPLRGAMGVETRERTEE
jgi:hypothetical protein